VDSEIQRKYGKGQRLAKSLGKSGKTAATVHWHRLQLHSRLSDWRLKPQPQHFGHKIHTLCGEMRMNGWKWFGATQLGPAHPSTNGFQNHVPAELVSN